MTVDVSPRPSWVLEAGFENRVEAALHGCFESNYQEFCDGLRTGEPASPLLPAPQTLDFAALAQYVPPPRPWFRPGWLGADPTVLAGAGGSGKSGLIQHEATAGALGRPYLTGACQPYTSLVWNCEDSHDDLWRRQARICEHEGIEMTDLVGKLHLVSRMGCENAVMAEVRRELVPTNVHKELREQVNDLRVDALWLDNAAHVLIGDHDNRTQVTAFINLLAGLVRGRPFAIGIALHVSRAQGSEFSGSVAWENAARMRWYLGSKLPDQRVEGGEPDNDSIRFLAKRKANFAARDHIRFNMDSGLLVPTQKPGTHVGGIVSAIDERRADEICIAGFKSLAARGIRTTDGKTTADYLPSQIVAKGFGSGYTKAELGSAMNRLIGRGVFRRDVIGKHANRSNKFGLVLEEAIN